jgi:hypothetical protein
MAPSPSPSPKKVPATSSKVTQEEQHFEITMEMLEEAIHSIENMADWKKEFFQESKKNLEQIIETWSEDDSSTVDPEELTKVVAEYNKMTESILRTTDEIKASIYELAKSKADILPMELVQEAKALVQKTPMQSQQGHYKSSLLKLEQTIQNHHPSTKGQGAPGQPLQKKHRTTNTTGNSIGTTAKTLPDLRNLSPKELTKEVNEYFTNVFLPARKLAKNAPTEEVKQKAAAIVKQHNQVIIHYQEAIRSKIFAGIQNGKTRTMEVSKAFRECFPCKYLSHPECFGVLPFRCLGSYHDVRLEWASIPEERKKIMLEEREALTQQFLKPTRVLYSPHTSLEAMLSVKVNESTDQKFNIFPPLSVREDKSCYYAFMLCPTEHFPQHTYMSAFQYCTYMLLYLKDCIDERRKTPACDAQMDQKFFGDKNYSGLQGGSVHSYITGITVTLVQIFKYGPKVPSSQMNGKMYQLNCGKDPYFQYFGIPLLLVAKRIFGKLLGLAETWGANHLENCGDTPKKFFDRVLYVLRTKGICSSKFIAANINVHGQFDSLIPTHCFYPFLRALQMLHVNWYSKSFVEAKCRSQWYFSITEEEKRELQDKSPIKFTYPGLGDIELQPLILSVENPLVPMADDYHPYKGPSSEEHTSFYQDFHDEEEFTF